MRRLSQLFVTVACLAASLPAASLFDSFEPGDPSLDWSTPSGVSAVVVASEEARLQGIALPVTGERVFRVAVDEAAGGLNMAVTGGPAQDMTVEAWVFCEGNDGTVTHAGYQGILARASLEGTQHFVRLVWDPDHSEVGDTGDGWMKLQAFDGTTWDYLGIDFSQFGAATDGYILNATEWESGWHLFKLEVVGNQASAYIDDMETPVVTGTLSVTLRDGGAGFYVWCSGDWAGHFDDFTADITELPPTDYDLLILGGEVYQSGALSSSLLDIGIVDDRIASMEADLSSFTARTVIDATDRLVVPGFIDTHTHADSGGMQSAYLRQGVTTLVAGNCGSSPGPAGTASFYANLEGSLGPNYVGLVGHNTLRSAVGLSGSTPTPTQMANMQSLIGTAMDAGAFGLSTGLAYATGFNSSTEEVIQLAEVVAARGGLYTTHMRDEGPTVLTSVAEAIEIGRESGCRVQISHAKCSGPQAWGLSDEFVDMVEAANAEGVRVRMDQYPYTASQTTINVLIPDWAETTWADAVANHREELEQGIRDLIAGRGGADRVFLISGSYKNQWLSDVAANLGKDPEDVIIDNIGLGGAAAVYHTMIEDDVQVIMSSPYQMVGSDGPTSGHPRGAGTFPRFWGYYGRDLGLFTPQELVDRTSTMAADQFRLNEQQRGEIHPGWFADIVILDWDTVASPATFDSPTLAPVGIDWVIVNGEVAVHSGSVTGARAGKVLRLTDSVSSVSGLMVR